MSEPENGAGLFNTANRRGGVRDPEAATIHGVLNDEFARQILVLTNHEPMTAQDLAEAMDVSLSTVYRRLKALNALNLVDERTEIDDDMNQYTLYENELEEIRARLEDGGFEIQVTYKSDMSDKFGELWKGFDEP